MKVRLQNCAGEPLYPVTDLSNVTTAEGPGIVISGDTISAAIATAAVTAASATRGIASFHSTYFTVNSGFVQPRLASTSQKGVASFNSTYFTVSSGVVSAKTATTSVYGMVKLAADAEALAGIESSKCVTPSALKYVLENSTFTGKSNLYEMNDVSIEPGSGCEAVSPANGDALLYRSNGCAGGCWCANSVIEKIIEHLNDPETCPVPSIEDCWKGYL